MVRRISRTKIESDLEAYKLEGFGGLNTIDDTTQIENTQCQDCLNIELAKEIKKRGGYVKVNATPISGSSGIYGLFPFYYSGGLNRKLIYASHTVVGEMNVGTGVSSSIITGLTSNQRMRAVTFKDNLILVNGAEVPQKIYDSGGTLTGADLGGSPPTARYIALHKNYIFLAGNDTYPSRLYYSNLDDHETWGSLDFFDVNPDDGDRIMGLMVTLDALIIFKEYNVYLLYGDTPTYVEGLTLWRIKKASTESGTVGQGSIAVIGKNLVYFSRNKGVQAFGGSISSSEIQFDSLTSMTLSDIISPTVKGLNETRFDQAEAISWDYKYILSVPKGSSTTNNFNLVYDYNIGGWYLWDIPANCWTVFRSASVDNLFIGDCSQGYIYRYTPDIFSDDGKAINAYYKTKDFDLGHAAYGKIFRKFYMTLNRASNFSLTITPQVNFGEVTLDPSSYTIAAKTSDSLWGTMVWGTDLWGEATAATSDKQVMNARGNYINYKFSNNILNQDMRIRNLTQFYRMRGAH